MLNRADQSVIVHIDLRMWEEKWKPITKIGKVIFLSTISVIAPYYCSSYSSVEYSILVVTCLTEVIEMYTLIPACIRRLLSTVLMVDCESIHGYNFNITSVDVSCWPFILKFTVVVFMRSSIMLCYL